MEQQLFIQHLMRFGLTRQEGMIYLCLLTEGKLTGYEAAKITGISRSNAYGSLAALAEKGAAYVVEESAKKYIPVPLSEFCENQLRSLREEKEWILSHQPSRKVDEEGYITVDGAVHILNKIRNMLSRTEERVYIAAGFENLKTVEPEIARLVKNGKKVVIITDHELVFTGAVIYQTESRGNQIGIITDSRYALTGEYGDGSMNTCLYSGQKNFVELFKTAMANEIKLIGYTKGEGLS